jgi:hypothetical protein
MDARDDLEIQLTAQALRLPALRKTVWRHIGNPLLADVLSEAEEQDAGAGTVEQELRLFWHRLRRILRFPRDTR